MVVGGKAHRRQPLPGAEFPAVHRQDQQHGGDHAEQRNRGERRGERAIGNLRQTADDHVLRIAGDRGDGADVGAHGDGQEVGHRVALHAKRQFRHQRRHHQADRVVDEEGREHAGRGRDGDQQRDRAAYMPCDIGVDDPEEARDPEIRHHDHHAEQEHDGIDVDGGIGLLRRQHPDADQHRTAQEGRARAVDAVARQLADGDDRIGGDEHQKGERQGEIGAHAGRDAPGGCEAEDAMASGRDLA